MAIRNQKVSKSKNTSAELVSRSVIEFMGEQEFEQVVPTIRVNSSGYPFMTFITADNEAENIYFSQKAAEKVDDETIVDREFIHSMIVCDTKNANGDERPKLAFASSGNRLNLSDLQ